MRKIIFVLLALLLTLAGCGKGGFAGNILCTFGGYSYHISH